MKPRDRTFPVLPLLIINIGAILFCAGGLAVILGWLPVSVADSGSIPAGVSLPAPAQLAAEQAGIAGQARVNARCAECGVIMSMQVVERLDEDAGPGVTDKAMAGDRSNARAQSPRTHEITVRLADGSRRVIHDANPAGWRLGERLIIIDGASPSSR